jgi:hypothetical protein
VAAKVIHFGVDDCYRINVLRRAGYDITQCSNLVQFRAALDSDADADVVMVTDGDGLMSLQAISMAHARCSAPIIVFPNPGRAYRVEGIDLMVPLFTPPEEWLLDLANLIVRNRVIRAYSRLLQRQSSQAGAESGAHCRQARNEWDRSISLRKAKPPVYPRREPKHN